MKHFVYVLYSSEFERFYVGMSSDVSRRLKQHNLGLVKSTKSFKPWKIQYTEKFNTSVEARKREKYLKSGAGRRWRKQNMGP